MQDEEIYVQIIFSYESHIYFDDAPNKQFNHNLLVSKLYYVIFFVQEMMVIPQVSEEH